MTYGFGSLPDIPLRFHRRYSYGGQESFGGQVGEGRACPERSRMGWGK